MRSTILTLVALMIALACLPAAAQGYGRYDVGNRSDRSFTRATDTRLARVVQVMPVEIERRGMNTGTVVGALLGGLAGKQVGHGAARDVATGVGALLGGHAGTRVQRRARNNIAYEIVYQELDGRSRRLQTIIQAQALARPGDMVFISGRGRDASLSPVSPEARAILEADLSARVDTRSESAHRRAARLAVARAEAEGMPIFQRVANREAAMPDTIDGLPVYQGASGY